MAKPNYAKIISRGWFTVALFGLLGLVLALLVSFVQPLKYSSTVRLLISQEVCGDAYVCSRSEELIAEKLSTIIYTTTFFDQILNHEFDIDQSIFPEQDAKRRREWGKTVATSVSRGSGILTISAYHTDVREAQKIVTAVAYLLTDRSDSFVSSANITIKLIDAPLNSKWPVKPNIVANGLSGAALGVLAGIAFVLMSAERIRRRHQFVHDIN